MSAIEIFVALLTVSDTLVLLSLGESTELLHQVLCPTLPYVVINGACRRLRAALLPGLNAGEQAQTKSY